MLHTAFGGVGLALAATASASEVPLTPAEQTAAPASLTLIDSSRLGCGQGAPVWTIASGGSQCAFDSATRGVRLDLRQDVGPASIETYAIAAHATVGAFTPDRLLEPRRERSGEVTDFFLFGLKGSAFEGRLRLTSEFARTGTTIDALGRHDLWQPDITRDEGYSTFVRLDAALLERPGLKWSVTGEYRQVSDDYGVGRARDLFRYSALPGTRLALTTKAEIGAIGLLAGMEKLQTPYGELATSKAGLDVDGLSLRLVSRQSQVGSIQGSTLIEGTTRSTAAYADIDTAMLVATLLGDMSDLPFIVPANVSISYRSGVTENRYLASTDGYERTSIGVEGNWETPAGETSLSYWRDGRNGFTPEARSGASETFEISHSVRRGYWRFGLDAALTSSRFDGNNGYREQSISFGQSLAYSAPHGPEFRLQIGQDRGRMRMTDNSFLSEDRYSQITASLDLSRYLQKRFERPDLRLTLDYRRLLDRSDEELSIDEEVFERWVDGYRREGVLMSFGMKL